MMLMQRLLKLTEDDGGKFLLVLVNTDSLGQIAHQYGVTSVPTVKFFRNGQVVHTIHGAESDAAFQQVLQRFIAREAKMAHAHALETQRRGDRVFRQDIGRCGLVSLFEMLGSAHPLTLRYRPLLASVLE